MRNRITEVDNDEEKFQTFFKAAPVEWRDITGTFDMEFGTAVLAPGAAKKLRKRQFGFLDDIVDNVGDFFGDVGSGVGDVIDNVGDFFGDVGDNIGDVIDNVGDVVGDVGEAVGGVVDDVVDNVGDVVGDIGETVGDIAGGALDVITGNIDLSEEVSFPIGIGSPNSPIDIFSNDIVDVDCSNCFIGGTFQVCSLLLH